jgi:hypothetical protein
MTKPRLFRFRGQTYLLTALAVISAFFWALGGAVETGRRGPFSAGEGLMFGSAFVFLLFGILIARDQSDILVDDHSVSRSLFGWKWKTLLWSNVALIRASPYFHPVLKKSVLVIRVYSSAHSDSSFRSADMRFLTVTADVDQLLELLNQNIARQSIRVEWLENGQSHEVRSLKASL